MAFMIQVKPAPRGMGDEALDPGLHGHLLVALTFVLGTGASFFWWLRADQSG